MSRRFAPALRLVVLGLAVPACIAATAAKPTQPATGAAVTSGATDRHCSWPGGAKAAVSLTYDDALGSQLEHAAPALARHGLTATFFLSGGNMSGFAPLSSAAHELASHTITHPCNPQLAGLTAADMGRELDAGIAAVQALGVTGKLTFAYPCGQTQVAAGASYVPLVRERFRAARGVAPMVADPARVDLYQVPALFPPASSDGSDAIELFESAAQTGGWAVLGVHGVTEKGEYLQLGQAAHERILAYLAEHRAELWTAPFGTVADAVSTCRAR